MKNAKAKSIAVIYDTTPSESEWLAYDWTTKWDVSYEWPKNVQTNQRRRDNVGSCNEATEQRLTVNRHPETLTWCDISKKRASVQLDWTEKFAGVPVCNACPSLNCINFGRKKLKIYLHYVKKTAARFRF